MKLWVKISLLMGVILFLAMGIFGGGIIYQTLEYNRNQMVESSQEQMKVNAAVLAKEIGDRSMEQFGDTTQRSYLTYLVQKYGGRDYMLLKDGEVVANQTRRSARLSAIVSFQARRGAGRQRKLNMKSRRPGEDTFWSLGQEIRNRKPGSLQAGIGQGDHLALRGAF